MEMVQLPVKVVAKVVTSGQMKKKDGKKGAAKHNEQFEDARSEEDHDCMPASLSAAVALWQKSVEKENVNNENSNANSTTNANGRNNNGAKQKQQQQKNGTRQQVIQKVNQAADSESNNTIYYRNIYDCVPL